jgi:hypothetical protein
MKRSGASRRIDQPTHLRSKMIAWLFVHLVTMSRGQQDRIAQQEPGDQRGDSAKAAHGHITRHLFGQECTRLGCRKWTIWHGHHRHQPGSQRQSMNLPSGSAEHQASINRGRSVVRMLFEVGDEFEDSPIVCVRAQGTPCCRTSRCRRRRRRAKATANRYLIVDDKCKGVVVSDCSLRRDYHHVEVPVGKLGADMANAPASRRSCLDEATQFERKR